MPLADLTVLTSADGPFVSATLDATDEAMPHDRAPSMPGHGEAPGQDEDPRG